MFKRVMVLPRDEADRRNKACKKLYYEKNREAILAKARDARQNDPEYNTVRRERYHTRIQELIDEGVCTPAKRGRNPYYQTHEEALIAKREQMRASRIRRAECLAHAEALLLQSKLGQAIE
jgi:hypothetical protein